MRDAFCKAMVRQAVNPDFVFLTGDLGFKALEPLREVLGKRFINAGVAEQNMVTVAAGMARQGMRPWVYSIAPFVYARPFEQIRNDVCLHDLPVVLVGNGGGYGYGVMGSTHHSVEDYGSLLCLGHIQAFVPAFDGDVAEMVDRLIVGSHPAYLRLGLSEQFAGMPMPNYSPWRKLTSGNGPTLLVVGPLVGGIVQKAMAMDEQRRPSIWLLSELPPAAWPAEFSGDLRRSNHLIVVEEHIQHGGAGEMIAHRLMIAGEAPRRFTHRTACGETTGRYGSQKYHRRECGLDPESVLEIQ
jgi:transketolase